MSNKNISFELKNAPINSLLIKFTIPAIISMLINAIYNIVDQIFLGNMIGPDANAATTVAFPLTMIILAISVLFGVGGGIFISTKLGEGKKSTTQSAFQIIFVIVSIIAIVITILGTLFISQIINLFGASPKIYYQSITYTSIIILGTWPSMMIVVLDKVLRADGSPKLSMIIIVFGAVLNTILDPIFINLYGIRGAAIATILSQYISAITMLLYIQYKGNIKIIFSKILSFSNESIDALKKSMYIGISSFIIQIGAIITQTIMNNQLVYYGNLEENVGGVIALASVGIILKIYMILVSVCVGIGVGFQPIISFNNGAKQYNRVKETFIKSIIIAFTFTVIGYIIIQLFPEYIIKIFDNSESNFQIFASKALRIMLSVSFVIGVQVISIMFIQSIGKPLISGTLSFIRQVVFLIPLIIIMPLFFGLNGILISVPISDFISFIITLIVTKKVSNGLKYE